MKDFRDSRIGVNDAARVLNVRTVDLKAAIRETVPLNGVAPPQPMYKTGGSNGWVFRAGDVMDIAEKMKAKRP